MLGNFSGLRRVRQWHPDGGFAEFVHTKSGILVIGAHAGHVAQSVSWRAIDDDFRPILWSRLDWFPVCFHGLGLYYCPALCGAKVVLLNRDLSMRTTDAADYRG